MEVDSKQTDILLSTTNSKNETKNGNAQIKRDFSSNKRIRQTGLELNFQHVNLNIKGTQILQDVSGLARPGEILAIMGPSGSGKTSLLNVLGGRVSCGNCHATIGGQTLNKRTRRKISYVLQEDIFFANLTLHDTLMFSSELRLPEDLSHQSKKEIVDDIVTQLEIKKSMGTIIGDSMVRGLSGGEKKRANIANELLTDPAVLLLDEPTSGLDSTTAFELALALKRYAVNNKKTVVMTVHQPSSQMFFLFNKVILLCKGQMLYHGKPDDVLDYFAKRGQTCTIPHYNPADYILDMAKSDDKVLDYLIESCNIARKEMDDCPILLHTLQQRKTNNYSVVNEKDKQLEMLMDSCNENTEIVKDETNLSSDEELLKYPGVHSDSVYGSERSPSPDNVDVFESRWTTSFLKQLTVLTHRSVVQGKSRYKDKLTYTKTIGVALICGLVWFQIGRGHPLDTAVPDIGAVLFFVTLFNSFNPLFEVLTCFPSEKVVINKERMAGSYRLSAYYFAKTISELPILFTNPTIFLMIVYWMAGLNGCNNFLAFLGTWIIFITTGIACQSIGIFASAATMDFQKGIVVGILIMITFILLGGFYVKNIPPWLDWLRYGSPITHAWSLLLYLEFDSDERILCSDSETSLFASCVSNSSITINVNQTEQMFVVPEDILAYNLADIPASMCVIALLSITIFFRILGYLCLRFFHKPASK